MTHAHPSTIEESFLLVAPLAPSDNADLGAMRRGDNEGQGLPESSGLKLLNRHVYAPQELRQTWAALPTVPTVPPVRRGWLVTIKNSSLLVLECTLKEEQLQVDEIETRLSGIAHSMCQAIPHLKKFSPEWVSRTLLLPDGGPDGEPRGWLGMRNATCLILDDPTRPIEAFLGWGNNTLRGWDPANDHPAQTEALMGLVDAQYLWMDLYATGRESARIAHSVINRPAKLGRKALAVHLDSLDRMSHSIILHRLAYDDLLMNIQGARHDISRTCLNAWGYTELFDRIAPRLPLISQAAEREFARSSRRYQRVVQLALTSVALLAAIDFVVGLYEMSIEGTGTIPSIASRALAALSESNADVLLLLGLLAGIIVAVVQSAGGGPR